MPALVVASGVRLRLDPADLRELARRLRRAALRLGVPRTGLSGLSVRVVGDREMAALNRHFAGDDHATDVLSFPDPQGGTGDIALNWDAVARQARGPGRSARLHEATVLLVHGLCHLRGHDHARRGDARRMVRAQRRGLRATGVGR
jgi:probable rRNA maturation factor